jgi:hypothetical protein
MVSDAEAPPVKGQLRATGLCTGAHKIRRRQLRSAVMGGLQVAGMGRAMRMSG